MSIEALKARAGIVREIRRFFDEQGFIEVETAVRIPAPAPEEHIDCPVVVARPDNRISCAKVEDITYLRASPELQMKKLLAAGMERIYQIGPCFREGEKGSRHNPEFTMIEWYRRDATYLDIKDDLERLLSRLFAGDPRTAGVRVGGFPALKVRDAYLRHAGWDPWLGEWDQDRFDFDMATKIEPAIKEMGGGVFLTDYPPQSASLAKIAGSGNGQGFALVEGDVRHAERWEFYYDGMELANCFTELCDREEQFKRFTAAKEARRRLGESDYPIDGAFIECLPLVKSAAGVALGVDRLVMVLTQAREISAVRAEI